MRLFFSQLCLFICFSILSLSFSEPLGFTSKVHDIRDMPASLYERQAEQLPYMASISLQNEPCTHFALYSATARDFGLSDSEFIEKLKVLSAQAEMGLYFNIQISSCNPESEIISIHSIEVCNPDNCPDQYVLTNKVWLDQDFIQTTDPLWITYYYHLPLQWDEQKQLWAVTAYYARNYYFSDIYETPPPIAFITYSQSDKVGQFQPFDQFTQYYPTGEIATEKWYGDQGEEGVVKNYFISGKLHQTAQFNNGLPQGNVITYHENGTIESDIPYIDGIPVDRFCKHYFDDGRVARTHTYYQGSFDGEYIDYYPDGKIDTKSQYHQGHLIGEKVSFYPSGQLEYRYQFSSTEPYHKDGSQVHYYEDGTIKRKEQYQDGTKTQSQEWNKKGVLTRLINLDLAGKKEGVQETRNADGQLTQQQNYRHGTMIGDNKEWDYKGFLLMHETYNDQGQPVGEHQYWNLYTQKLAEKKTYDENGTLLLTEKHEPSFETVDGKVGVYQITTHNHIQGTHQTIHYDQTGNIIKTVD